MSQRAVEFVERWIDANIHAGSHNEAGGLAQAELCAAAAEANGITRREIEDELGDLVELMGVAIKVVN